MLARADVRDERSPARHVVVERVEYVQRRVEPIGQSPPVGFDHGVAPGEGVVVDAREVHRDTRLPGPIDSTVRPAVWIERIRAVVDPGSVTTA